MTPEQEEQHLLELHLRERAVRNGGDLPVEGFSQIGEQLAPKKG